MADGLQDAPRHAGQVVRRVLLRRNIVIDPETASLSPPPSRRRSKPVPPPGRRAGARMFLSPTASRCSYLAPAIRPRCSCRITGARGAPAQRRSRRRHPVMVGVAARER